MKSCNLRVTSQLYYCSYPLSMDLYNGCPHGCSYCFARANSNFSFVMEERDYNLAEPLDYKKLINLINGTAKQGKSNMLLQHLIDKRQPIHIGGNADPFPRGVERRTGHAKNFLQEIGDYPIMWSTKNPMLGEYPDLFAQGNHVLQVSIIGFGSIFKQIERGCISAEERLERCKQYKGKAKKIIVRMQPYFPQLHTPETVDTFMKKLAESNAVDGVTLESFKMGLSMDTEPLSKALGFDIRKEMITNGQRLGKDVIIPTNIKIPYIKQAKEAAHKYGLEFYSSDNQTRSLGDCAQCRGIKKDELPDFQSKMNTNWSELVFLLKEKKKVKVDEYLGTMADITNEVELASMGFNHGNKRGRAEAKLKTLKEHFEEVMKTRNANNPAIVVHNIGLRKINGELYFTYEGDL